MNFNTSLLQLSFYLNHLFTKIEHFYLDVFVSSSKSQKFHHLQKLIWRNNRIVNYQKCRKYQFLHLVTTTITWAVLHPQSVMMMIAAILHQMISVLRVSKISFL